MCPSSHVLPPLLGELTDTHACASVHENRRAYACRPICIIFFCLCVQHTHTHTDEFTGGQAGGLAWAEMNTCWDQSISVWFTFLSLSLFLSISCFLLSLDTPLPPLLALFSPLKNLAVEDLFRPKYIIHICLTLSLSHLKYQFFFVSVQLSPSCFRPF